MEAYHNWFYMNMYVLNLLLKYGSLISFCFKHDLFFTYFNVEKVAAQPRAGAASHIAFCRHGEARATSTSKTLRFPWRMFFLAVSSLSRIQPRSCGSATSQNYQIFWMTIYVSSKGAARSQIWGRPKSLGFMAWGSDKCWWDRRSTQDRPTWPTSQEFWSSQSMETAGNDGKVGDIDTWQQQSTNNQILVVYNANPGLINLPWRSTRYAEFENALFWALPSIKRHAGRDLLIGGSRGLLIGRNNPPWAVPFATFSNQCFLIRKY